MAMLLMLVAAAMPQAVPTAPPGPPAKAPVDPTFLPGDGPPPPLATMLRVKTPRPPATPRPLDTTPAVPLNLAIEAAQSAIDTCRAQGLRISVAVTDAAGHLRVALSAEGAPPPVIFVAARKDVTAVTFRVPTSVVQERLRAAPSEQARLTPNMAIMPGGVPLFAGSTLIGAIAGSGATGQQDEACAAAGAARIKDRLR